MIFLDIYHFLIILFYHKKQNKKQNLLNSIIVNYL